MPKDATGCQRMSQDAKGCQRMLKDVKGYQKMPKDDHTKTQVCMSAPPLVPGQPFFFHPILQQCPVNPQ